MKKMIAESKLRHNGAWLTPGDTFTCNDSDAEDFRAMRMARYATVTEKAADAVQSAAETVQAAAEAVVDATKRGPRPTYRRRDMNSEQT